MLSVRWSPDGLYLAAVPLYERRVLVWHTFTHDWSAPELVARLAHSRIVHAIDWRTACQGHASRPVLVVTTANRAACVYAPVADEPYVLRQWAAVDAAVDMGTESPSEPVALMYCDAYRLSVALQHDMDQLIHAEQREHAGVQHRPDAELQRSRLHQLQQLLAHAPDLFLAVLADGSIAVYALMNLESSTPMLLNTYVILRLPRGIVVEPSSAPTLLQFVPLAYQGAPTGGGIVPTAIIHAQSANGMRGTAAISLAFLLDGDQRGIFVQDMLVANEREPELVPATSAPMRFLRAEHKTDIVGLYPTRCGRSLVSLSLDGVLIGWHLNDQAHASLLSEHRVRFRGASAACVLDSDSHVAVVVDGRIAHVTMDPTGIDQGARSLVTADIAVETHDLPEEVAKQHALAFGSVQLDDGACLLVLCTPDRHVCSWRVESDERSYRVGKVSMAELGGETSLGALRAAVLVEITTAGAPQPSLCTMDEHGTLNVWTPAWHSRLHTTTPWKDVRAMVASGTGHVAVVAWSDGWHVSIWDLRLSAFAGACVYTAQVRGDEAHRPCLAWSLPERGGALLAIGTEATVQICAPTTPAHGVGAVPPTWAPLAQVDISAGGSGTVSHLAWLAGQRLLVSSTCQLFLYAASTDEHDQAHWLPVLAAQQARLLPLYHPRHVQYCLQMRLMDVVHGVLHDLRRAMASSLYDPETPAETSVDWRLFRQRAAPGEQGREPMPAAQVQELLTTLAERRAPGLSADDTQRLRAVLQSLQATTAEPVDEAGRLFLTHLYAACDGVSHDMRAAPPMPSGAMLFWGQQSTSQEILMGRVHAVCGSQAAWPALCASGVFAWCRDRASLVPLMEQAARAAYTAGDDVDPVPCTLFYLAMRRETTVRSLWRRAHGHPDQAKMNRFLANDFNVERWRVAAQKNAFALISQRRFDFAAAFFLLGGALQDAVNVCVRSMHNLPLAIAIARVYEDEDCGPVFRRVLERHVVPLAIERGDRWLGCWALSVLGEYAAAVRMIEVRISKLIQQPLELFARDERNAAWSASEAETVGADAQDPALILAVDHGKTHGWGSVQDERALLVLSARRWQDMGTCSD